MQEDKIKVLLSAIKAKKYEWEPAVTSVSELSRKEQEARLGLTVDKAELDATEAAISAAQKSEDKLQAVPHMRITAPAAVDWRNKGGDWTTPIQDQGGCGSCVAFATAATLESRINIGCKNPNLDKNLSEAHIFYCGCGNCCGTGWNFPPALNFCKDPGVALESAFPYTAGNQPCKPGVKPYIKITDWKAILPMSDRKDIIARKGPVVGGMAVYADFFSYKSGVYKKTSTDFRGHHAISVVGYDDARKAWICKNSWGAGWGDNGWFMIGYGQCKIDTSFAFYDMDLKCPDPTPDCGKYKTGALRYLKLYRMTHNMKYLCIYYRYAAAYYACMYRSTKIRKYLCLYYRYRAMYFLCQYRVTKNIQYLMFYKRYYAAYKRCR